MFEVLVISSYIILLDIKKLGCIVINLFFYGFFKADRLVGLVVKAFASRAKEPGFESRFSESSHTSDLKLALQLLPCQAPGDIGSALGLVGPVSVYCDLVWWKVGSATSISVWQHVKLSEQIHP